MKTLKNFIDNQAEELLHESDLADITGGASADEVEKINALADCSTTNNCASGNCVAGCGG